MRGLFIHVLEAHILSACMTAFHIKTPDDLSMQLKRRHLFPTTEGFVKLNMLMPAIFRVL